MERDGYKEKKLLLVAGSISTQKSLAKQLSGFLPKDIEIIPYVVDEIQPQLQGKYFTVFSSEEVYSEFLHQGGGDFIEDYIIGTRTVLNSNIDKILTLPRDQKILLVADSKIDSVK